MSAAEPSRKRPAEGEVLACGGCGGTSYEIRYGTKGEERPTVTCVACLEMWWLTAAWDTRAVRLTPVPQDVAPLPEAPGFRVNVAMTLTAPGCGMGPAIAEDARARLAAVPGVSEAKVEIMWDPPWNQDRISEAGKMQLGLI